MKTYGADLACGHSRPLSKLHVRAPVPLVERIRTGTVAVSSQTARVPGTNFTAGATLPDVTTSARSPAVPATVPVSTVNRGNSATSGPTTAAVQGVGGHHDVVGTRSCPHPHPARAN